MRRKVGPLCLIPERFPMFPVSLSVLIRRTTLAVSVSMNSMITATIRSPSARIARIAAATSAMKPSSGRNASGVILPDFLFADNVRRLGQMNHRFRKTALFAVFFLLRGGGHPIGRAGGNRRTEKRFLQNDKKPVWKIRLLLLVSRNRIEWNGRGY